LLGIERLAATLGRGGDLGEVTLAEADHTARFIAGCYAAFPRFEAFTAYSMLYFAAASFSEMQRRLAPEHASGGFLRAADANFVSAVRDLSPASCGPGADYAERIASAIAPINVAGLCDRRRGNWYPVDLEDTARAAHKLGLTPARVRAALEFANVASAPHFPHSRRDQRADAGTGIPLGPA
jgi:FADH2 O2-dependent halogenase